jgi:hypothetical protein
MPTHSEHIDQVSQEAVRVLTPPTPRFCSLAPSVTLYTTAPTSPSIRDRLYLANLGEHKDASGLYLSDQERFEGISTL